MCFMRLIYNKKANSHDKVTTIRQYLLGMSLLFPVLLFCCLFLSQSFGDNVKVDGLIAFIVIKEIIHLFGTQERYSVFAGISVCKFRYDCSNLHGAETVCEYIFDEQGNIFAFKFQEFPDIIAQRELPLLRMD